MSLVLAEAVRNIRIVAEETNRKGVILKDLYKDKEDISYMRKTITDLSVSL